MKNDKTDFTQGSILKKLALFMLPILGALVLQAAYGAVDLLVVGHFGSTSGLSAVSTGSQVLNLVTFAFQACDLGPHLFYLLGRTFDHNTIVTHRDQSEHRTDQCSGKQQQCQQKRRRSISERMRGKV